MTHYKVKGKKATQHNKKTFYRSETQGHSSSGAQAEGTGHWDSDYGGPAEEECPPSCILDSLRSALIPIFFLIRTANQVQIMDFELPALPYFPTLMEVLRTSRTPNREAKLRSSK